MSDASDIVRAAVQLTTEVAELSDRVGAAQASVKRLRILTVVVGVLVAALIVLMGFTINAQHYIRRNAAVIRTLATENHRLTECVNAWADEFTVRSEKLSILAQQRQNALSVMIRTLTIPNPQQRDTAFESALNAYLAADDAYTKTVKTNPLPPPPRLTCANQ